MKHARPYRSIAIPLTVHRRRRALAHAVAVVCLGALVAATSLAVGTALAVALHLGR